MTDTMIVEIDRALKSKLTYSTLTGLGVYLNITTGTITTATAVPIHIKSPEVEFAETEDYAIGIWWYDMEEDTDRRQSGIQSISISTATRNSNDYPVPYNLYYQIDTYANYASWDRDLVYQISKLLPARGYLSVPYLGSTLTSTIVGCDLIAFENMDTLEGEGEDAVRSYRKVFRYKILTEMYPTSDTIEKIVLETMTISPVMYQYTS